MNCPFCSHPDTRVTDSRPEVGAIRRRRECLEDSGGCGRRFSTLERVELAGVSLAARGGAWSTISDRSVKANFAPVDGREVLDLVAEMPIASWGYKSQDASIRHIGPTAQDFYDAFAVGEDDKHITTVDADGVALAAIQGLYELVQEQEAQIAALENGAGIDTAASGPSSSGLSVTSALVGGLLALGLALVSGLLLVALRAGRGRGAQA
ncbi:MAG: tail fiber domain-containing protein [Chloroflexi bacterium]|nr:tail fiber domain-containing protein [Chloroflexota bacterium]